MRIKNNFSSFILSISFLALWSCSDDDSNGDDDITSGCADFQTEWADVANAISVYSENPNTENCENYKSALLDFYQEFQDCQYWGQEYQEAIDEVQEMDCSEIES